MSRVPLFVMLALLLLVAGPADVSAEDAPAAQQVELKYKAYRNWKIELPATKAQRVGTVLKVAGASAPFAMKLDGEALTVDTDGDGSTDVTIEGDKGFAAFKTAGESPYRYALRLVKGQSGWVHIPGSARVGTIDGIKVQVIDQDGNGAFNDIGTDAMIVGSSSSAAFLSNVINVAGKLYSVTVAKDGSTLDYTPFTGKTGTLDLLSAHESKTKVITVLVKSADGKTCFDLARAPEGLTVPAGTYTLVGGRLGLGEARAAFVTGRAKPIAVAADAVAKVAWGGPLRAEYQYGVKESELVFHPKMMWFYGKAGEQYVGWKPFGKSPVFTLTDKSTREEIAQAIFTGT